MKLYRKVFFYNITIKCLVIGLLPFTIICLDNSLNLAASESTVHFEEAPLFLHSSPFCLYDQLSGRGKAACVVFI